MSTRIRPRKEEKLGRKKEITNLALIEELFNELWSSQKIAKLLGVSDTAIRVRASNDLGLQFRSREQFKRFLDMKCVAHRYVHHQMSITNLAEETGLWFRVIKDYLIQKGIHIRDKDQQNAIEFKREKERLKDIRESGEIAYYIDGRKRVLGTDGEFLN